MIIQCQECKNDKELAEDDLQVGRWFECGFCGTTYEITAIEFNGAPTLEMVEEEK